MNSIFDDKQNLGDMVNLVDFEGNILSSATKLDAHQNPGQLHLAFSIFLFLQNSKKVLLQKRAYNKYHFPGKWANTCCSHPRPGEEVTEAAQRRLDEELGLEAELHKIASFIYRARCEKSSLVEYEFDHVLIGSVAEDDLFGINPAKTEIADLALVDTNLLFEGQGFTVEKSVLLGKEYSIAYNDMAPWVLPALAVGEKRIKNFLEV